VVQILRCAQDDNRTDLAQSVILSKAKDLDHGRFGLASGAQA
jgi:hypothetical protein